MHVSDAWLLSALEALPFEDICITSQITVTGDAAPQDAFRVKPGAAMPPVEGCAKQDYLVLFVVALPADKVAAN